MQGVAMGRLDEHAKRRIVELRRAGLSFRKIKKVLELDDIRVTPQAVYLFLKRRSVEPGVAAWDGDQPWPPMRGREDEPPQPPAGPLGDPTDSYAGNQDTKEGIRIVGVTSLCKDSGQLGDTLPTGLAPGNGDDGSTGTPLAPGGLANLPPPLPGPGQLVTPPSRNPALVVQTGAVDRAVVLQRKVKDASTQTAPPSPGRPEDPNPLWGVPVPTPAPSWQTIADRLDAVRTEVQKLSQTLQVVLERQCRLERQQEQQQQEVLVTLQQLSSTVSHGALPCAPFGSVAEPEPTVPTFGQFKMELI